MQNVPADVQTIRGGSRYGAESPQAQVQGNAVTLRNLIRVMPA